MTNLITRLSKLDAPDREVDAEIYILFNIPAERAGRIDYSNGMVGWWPKDGPYVSAVTVPAYTASVDAVIALAERVLPGWYWGITQGDDGEDATEFQGNVWPSIQPYPAELEQYGYHKFPAIALLIALLRAKEASKL